MRLLLRLPQPAIPACLGALAALATSLMLLGPAQASAGRRDRAATQPRCAKAGRGGSPKPARGSRGRARRCVKASARRRRAPAAAGWIYGGGALEATPLQPAGALPLSPAVDPSPTTPDGGSSPASSGGTSGEGGRPQGKGPLPAETGEVLNDPIDPRFMSDLPFGTRSFWLQQWRAYQDTWPASRLLESVGVNFNLAGPSADATAQLLHDSGFKLARIGINWSALSYTDPTSFRPENLTNISARLNALHNHGLRPLIVLDAYSGAPTPEKHLTLETTAAAPAGSQSVHLTPVSAAAVIPGKTGFNYLSFGGAPDILITSVDAGGTATLSRPLLEPLAQGPHGGTTLLYAPFARPTLASGEPNPAFQATLAGWLSYVAAVCREAASIAGPGGFDLEIWNELTFGSQFLNAENYYSTTAPEGQAGASSASEAGTGMQAGADVNSGGEASPEPSVEEGAESSPATEYGAETEGGGEGEGGPRAEGGAPEAEVRAQVASATPQKQIVNKEIRKALLAATVAFVRDPANGISPGVGITDGFASETPFPSGAAAPIGLTALSKHPYVGVMSFPSGLREAHLVPVNALDTRDSAKGSFTPLFTPSYQSLLPEYTLTGLSTETLTRDLAPFTTYIYHFPHGRYVGPPGGSPLQKWITEYTLSPGKATLEGPDGVTPQTGSSATLTPADRTHFRAKALLRSLVAMVNKGISREYFFAASPSSLGMVSEGFFSAAEAHPGTYPGDSLGGETMDAFRNMLARFQGPGPNGAAQQLKLLSIAQDGNHAQFAGDGTDAHPPLYDRDVLAVLPFQSSPTRFVIPVYVMTRDLLTLYEPSAPSTDIRRFDLPDETFRITLGNLPETAAAPSISAYDPLHGESTPARLISREGSRAVVEFSATDYPRLLTVSYP
jgi:hypothetical protein